MSDEDSGGKQAGTVGIVIAVITVVGSIVVAWLDQPKESPAPQPSLETSPTSNPLSFRDWEGRWNLELEYKKNWTGTVMDLKSDQSGIIGNYKLGTLEGSFLHGDFSIVTGTYENPKDCSPDVKSPFSFKMSDSGKRLDGSWTLCGTEEKYRWRAFKVDSSD